MSSIISFTTARCESVNWPLEANRPLFLPRSIVSVVMPILSNRPRMAILPPTTPIEPVIVPGAATILSAPIEM